MNTRSKAIIVDLDGTLVDVREIRHFLANRPRDFDSFHSSSRNSPPNEIVGKLVTRLNALGFQICVLSGRSDKWRDLSTKWLAQHNIPHAELLLRAIGDFRADIVVKQEMFLKLGEKYDVVLAFDDNPAIVSLWRELGIPCVAVPGWD